MFLQLFLWGSTYFTSFMFPFFQHFRHIASIKFKMSIYFSFNGKMSHFQHLICLLCSIVNQILIYDNNCKLLHFLFIYILQIIQTSLELGRYIVNTQVQNDKRHLKPVSSKTQKPSFNMCCNPQTPSWIIKSHFYRRRPIPLVPYDKSKCLLS